VKRRTRLSGLYLEIPPQDEMAQGDQMVHAAALLFEPRANRCNRTKLATQIPAINPFTYSRSRVLNSLNTPGPNFSILLKCRYLGEHTEYTISYPDRCESAQEAALAHVQLSLPHTSATLSVSVCIRSQGYITFYESLTYITYSFNRQ
jgi:hypothetical protein